MCFVAKKVFFTVYYNNSLIKDYLELETGIVYLFATQ